MRIVPPGFEFEEDSTFWKGHNRSRMRLALAQFWKSDSNQVRFQCNMRYIHNLVGWVKKMAFPSSLAAYIIRNLKLPAPVIIGEILRLSLRKKTVDNTTFHSSYGHSHRCRYHFSYKNAKKGKSPKRFSP